MRHHLDRHHGIAFPKKNTKPTTYYNPVGRKEIIFYSRATVLDTFNFKRKTYKMAQEYGHQKVKT